MPWGKGWMTRGLNAKGEGNGNQGGGGHREGGVGTS